MRHAIARSEKNFEIFAPVTSENLEKIAAFSFEKYYFHN